MYFTRLSSICKNVQCWICDDFVAEQRNLELRVLDEFSTTRSGRSFNNASQYPIFPWILTNFDSAELDLKDEKIYRDLSLPAGALAPEKLKFLVERMSNEMSEKNWTTTATAGSNCFIRSRSSNNSNKNYSNNSLTKENDFFQDVESNEMYFVLDTNEYSNWCLLHSSTESRHSLLSTNLQRTRLKTSNSLFQHPSVRSFYLKRT